MGRTQAQAGMTDIPPYDITLAARSDLNGIRIYLDRLSEDAWPAVRKKLVAAFHLISENPRIGRRRPEITERPYRFYSIRPHPYIIVYDPGQQPLAIARVIHGAQDLKEELRKVRR
jgi:plasmid stabilization system protein ParE